MGESPELVLLKAYRFMANQLIESLTLLRAGRKFYPEDPRFLLALSQAHRVKGENELSVLRLQEAAALVPNAPSLQLIAVLDLLNAGAPLMAHIILIDLLDRTPKTWKRSTPWQSCTPRWVNWKKWMLFFSAQIRSRPLPVRVDSDGENLSKTRLGFKKGSSSFKNASSGTPNTQPPTVPLADAFAGLALHGRRKNTTSSI